MKPFVSNAYPTIGIEEEYHLIDPQTGDLCPRVDAVLGLLDNRLRERTTHELLQCVLEGRSGVCRTVDELTDDVRGVRTGITEACSRLGIRMVAAGSHPFGSWRDMPFVENEHYAWVRDNYGYIAHRLLAFGMHIHVGVQSADAALYVMHEMRRWAYPLVALAANSPYYEGLETGLVSTRTHLFNSMPRTMLAPPFETLDELVALYEKLLATGDVTRPGDLWWAIRPQVPLGTVEFRLFDLQTSLQRVGALAALVQAAVATYQDAYVQGTPRTGLNDACIEQNRWRAMQRGLQAEIIDPATGEVLSNREQLRRLIALVSAKARELQGGCHLALLDEMLALGSEAELQRARCRQLGGDLRALEIELADKTVEF